MKEFLFDTVLDGISGVLWGPWTFFILMFAGILFTVWTRFSQFKVLTHGVQVVRGVYDNPDDPGAINHFQALAAALSATVGLGNIGGVALAIGIGGPGSLFWMWIIGFLGMALKTVEITLAMMYRNTDDPENPSGGAMWVIDKTLGKRGGIFKVIAKIMGGFFCATLLISTMTGGNMFQAWNVADLTNLYFGFPQIGTGIVLAVLCGLVIIGGIKRIGNVAGKLVPAMCALYILAAFVVIGANIADVPSLLWLVVESAFSDTDAAGAFLGGTAGFAFTVGLKRALFSNEAGQGSAPIAHAAAKTSHAAREGVVGGLGPFIDTIVICTLTALVILSTNTWNRAPLGEMEGEMLLTQAADGTSALSAPESVDALPSVAEGEEWHAGSQIFVMLEGVGSDAAEEWLAANPGKSLADAAREPSLLKRHRVMGELTPDNKIDWGEPPMGARWLKKEDGSADHRVYRDYKGATLTSHAFDRAFPGLGKWLVTLASWFFALSTMISWSYYGENGVLFLFGKKGILPYKVIFLLATMLAPIAVSTDRELGQLADFGTGFMLWANMPIVLLMGFLAVRDLRVYFEKLKAGEFKRYDKPDPEPDKMKE